MSLLEVLAAIALLGIVFTQLSGSATFGVLSEGDSRRRLEASLVADSELAQIEISANAGAVPEIGVFEAERDGFEIEVDTQPWALPDRLRDEREAHISVASEVFGNLTPGNEGLVREIHLSVAWFDGVNRRSVTRTTFVVDFSSAAEGLDLPLPGLLGGALSDALDGLPDGTELPP